MCSWCGKRPHQKGSQTCYQCGHARAEVARENDQAGRDRTWHSDAWRVVTWKGHVIKMVPAGYDKVGCPVGGIRAGYVGSVSLKGVPQEKVLDLGTWLPGFTREQVKRLKRAFYPYLHAGITDHTSGNGKKAAA